MNVVPSKDWISNVTDPPLNDADDTVTPYDPGVSRKGVVVADIFENDVMVRGCPYFIFT